MQSFRELTVGIPTHYMVPKGGLELQRVPPLKSITTSRIDFKGAGHPFLHHCTPFHPGLFLARTFCTQ